MGRRAKPQLAGGNLNQRKKLVEEFILLDREVQAFKPRLLRHEKLRQLILDWYPEVPGEDEIHVPGISTDVLISARDKMRTVTLDGRQKLYKLWGQQQYLERSHIFLKALPDPEDKKSLYSIQTASGPRHLSVSKVKAIAIPA